MNCTCCTAGAQANCREFRKKPLLEEERIRVEFGVGWSVASADVVKETRN